MRRRKWRVMKETDIAEFGTINKFIVQDRRLSRKMGQFHSSVTYQYGVVNGQHFDSEYGVGLEYYRVEDWCGCVNRRDGAFR